MAKIDLSEHRKRRRRRQWRNGGEESEVMAKMTSISVAGGSNGVMATWRIVSSKSNGVAAA